MTFDFSIPTPSDSWASIVGSWNKEPSWDDWKGVVTAERPLVSISLLKVENNVRWARSSKLETKVLDVLLRIAFEERYYVTFFIGESGPQFTAPRKTSNILPMIEPVRRVAIGMPFLFSPSFGIPGVELWTLLLFREQVTGSRNQNWQIKEGYRKSVPSEWIPLLTSERSGSFQTK